MKGQYDFCPKCGALMREGVCQSCGFIAGAENAPVTEKEVQPVQPVPETTDNYYTPFVTPPPTTDWREVRRNAVEQRQNAGPYGANSQSGAMPVQGNPNAYAQSSMPAMGNMPQQNPISQPNPMPQQNPISQQNPMPQQSGMNYYGANGGGGMPPYGAGAGGAGSPKKNGNTAIIVVCIIAVLAAVFIIVAGIMAQRAFNRIVEEKRIQDEYIYDDDEDEFEDYYDDDYDDEDEEYDEDLYGVTPDALYYEGLTDSIDYDVDYSVSFESYTSEDTDEFGDNVQFHVYYVLLEGEQIPNLEEINEQLAFCAKWYVSKYAEEADGGDCYITSYAYVTYNDEHKVSIVLSETAETKDRYYTDLYPINIDLVNGAVTPVTDMIRVDADLAREFKEKSIEQNGEDFPNLTEEEIYSHMTDPDSLIVFYTPVGLEVGINYEDVDGYTGWITVTYKDYGSLLKQTG